MKYYVLSDGTISTSKEDAQDFEREYDNSDSDAE
mgnify:CR=1 FL=1